MRGTSGAVPGLGSKRNWLAFTLGAMYIITTYIYFWTMRYCLRLAVLVNCILYCVHHFLFLREDLLHGLEHLSVPAGRRSHNTLVVSQCPAHLEI